MVCWSVSDHLAGQSFLFQPLHRCNGRGGEHKAVVVAEHCSYTQLMTGVKYFTASVLLKRQIFIDAGNFYVPTK